MRCNKLQLGNMHTVWSSCISLLLPSHDSYTSEGLWAPSVKYLEKRRFPRNSLVLALWTKFMAQLLSHFTVACTKGADSSLLVSIT